MKKLFLSLLFFCGVAYGQTPTITTPTFTDDSYVNVPLQFGFPFYNRVFTNSWMHSNGIVSFFDPASPLPGSSSNPAAWAYCCAGVDLVSSNAQLGPQFNYMISALWTDLYPIASSSFRTEGTSTYQRYFWNNIPEISNYSNLSSFSLEIRPSGYIGASYSQLGVRNQDVTAGITGDVALGEMQKFYFGRGIPGQSLQDWSVNSTGNACSSNPLSSPTCPGYAAAYLAQQCSVSALYDPSCPGYQQAYFSQQCSVSPLFDPSCPGYASANLSYQCSVNPLYDTSCSGYQQAYFNQQCSINPLSSRSCSGYSRTYALQNLLSVSPVNNLTANISLESSLQVPATSTSPADVTAVVNLTTSAVGAGRLYGTGTVKKEDEEDLSLLSTNSNSSKLGSDSKADKKLKEEKEKKSRKKEETAGEMTEFDKQVAQQPKIIDAMGFVPGFSLYAQAKVPDVLERQLMRQYGKDVIDNRQAGRRLFGASDRLHQEMVDGQYK